MKKNILILFLFLSFGLLSCIKNPDVKFSENLVEFDATTWNSNTAYTPKPDSIAFAIMTRVPVPGRAATTADAVISRTSGNVNLRVNLLGPHRSTDTEINYTVVNNYSLISPVVGVAPAVAGTHYGALAGKVTIPANSSFGTLTIPILDPGAGTGTRELVLRLQETNGVKPNYNYSIIGIRIAQQ